MKPTLLVLAAGMGSRYGGVKQIDAVGQNGECLLDFANFDAKKSGFGNVVFIIRKDIEADFRAKLFDRIAANFDAEYVFQSRESLLTQDEIAKTSERKKPWGTIHAVLCAEEKIKSPFAVINSDDYYGREAFATLGNYLSGVTNDCTEHAMVGYVLGNTMSKSGSVSRGVCTVKNGYLDSIVENTKISYEGNGIVFTPKAFEGFHEYWENFRKEGLYTEKQEALLPVAASDIVKNGEGKIKFFTSTESWFGMTYPEDREIVKQEIINKINSGYYPAKLWEK